MSCVVGLVQEDRVWLGGDSAAADTEDGPILAYTTPKVFRRGPLLFGVVYSFRMRDLLRYQFQVPRFREGQNRDEYIFKTVLDEVRWTLEVGGFALDDEIDEEIAVPSGAFMLGFKGRLFTVDWDYHIGEVWEPYMAIGAGAAYALGSLYTTQGLTETPQIRLLTALRASTHYCGTVRPPYRIASIR